MAGSAELKRLVDGARRDRCLLADKWLEGAVLSGRDQLALAKVLLEVKPVQVERDGRRVPCEPAFTLAAKDRRRLVQTLLADGASDGEILACVPGLTKRTYERIKRDAATPGTGSANGSSKGRFTTKSDPLLGTPGYAFFDATSGANPDAHRRLLAALAG